MSSEIICYAANVLTEEEIQACLSLIEEGNAVDPKSVRSRLRQAPLIVIKREGQEIVGVGAIKKQRPRYASTIANKSGFAFDIHLHELGYVAVKESYQGQGLSREITAKLLSEFNGYSLFATTSNNRMKQTLKHAGFIQKGNEWEGTKQNRLSLWIRTSN